VIRLATAKEWAGMRLAAMCQVGMATILATIILGTNIAMPPFKERCDLTMKHAEASERHAAVARGLLGRACRMERRVRGRKG